jgi:transcription elongation factor Elf1
MKFISKPGTVERKKELAEILRRHKEHFGGFLTCLRCNVEPKLTYKVDDSNIESFVFYCPKCGFTGHQFEYLQPAITCWYFSNRREHHTRVMWNERYQNQIAERKKEHECTQLCVND